MTNTNVHLEDVARAARQGIALSLAGSFLALAAMLVAGRGLWLSAAVAIALAVVGCASGGFGLVARISLRTPRLPQRRDGEGVSGVPPVRIPQPR
jgi:hypothetical protein